MKKVLVLLSMFFVPGTLFLLGDTYEINDQKLHDLLNDEIYIAHAGGGYNGMSYTNSKEGYELALSKGVRLIEFDVHVVNNEIYFFHSFNHFEINCGVIIDSYDEVYMSYDSCPYSQVTIKDVESITKQGNVVILDVKNAKGIETYEKIYELLGNNMIVPQVYDYYTLTKLTKLYLFDHIIYRNDDGTSSRGLNYLNPNISMSISKSAYIDNEDYLSVNRKVFLYTVNKDENIPEKVGIYTDDYYL